MGNPHMGGGPHGAPPDWTAWPEPPGPGGPPPGPPAQFGQGADPQTAPLPRVGGGARPSGARRIAAILALVGGALTVVAFMFLALVSIEGIVSVTGSQAAREASTDFRLALLWLLPVGAAVAAGIGAWLLRAPAHPRTDRTGFTIVLVAAAVVALAYIGGFFYLQSQLGELGVSALDVAGIGFWLGLLGMVIAIIGAIIGLATAGRVEDAGPAPPVGPAPIVAVLAAIVLVGVAGGATAMLNRAGSALGIPRPSSLGLPGSPPGVPRLPTGLPTGPVVPPAGSPGAPGAPGAPGTPPGAGGRAAVASASAACTAAPSKDAAGAAVDFEAGNMIDGKPDTAWRCDGDGAGQIIELQLAGPTVVNAISVIPGYAKTDPSDGTDRYLQNRRISEVRYEFDDGTKVVHTLDPTATRRGPQQLAVNGVTTSRIRIVIVSSVPGGESKGNAAVDKVAISEVAVS